jgi:predicted Zn finger-like uncharacterized protein|mmetsp:Transcript_15654/g.18865  ORF Transcript_15654/g.18865 Transcript_15654/m.18865 type:complete len:212 (+) Transcript_15654:126-761(+)
MKLFILISVFLSAATAFMAPAVQPAGKTSSSSVLFMSDTIESKQKEYGQSLELPTTYVRCGRCQSVYAMTADDLGNGKGVRLECSVCKHSWFQSRERLMDLRDGYELLTLPEQDKKRIALNLEEGKSANFMGEIKLYVGNISFECDEDQIREVFEEIGGVGDVSLVKDDLGRNRGFGFVTMRNKADGETAMEKLDGSEVNGRNIAVRESTN